MDLGKLTALQLAEKIKQHQISVLPLQIAERGLLHAASLPVCDLPLFYQLRAEK